MTERAALQVRGLHAWYGESHVLHGVDLDLRDGEVVSLLGRNGSGRTTTLRALLGLVDQRVGSVIIGGTETIAKPSHLIARLGVGYCPEERGIFASLTAEENLVLLPRFSDGGLSVTEIYEMFPNLLERSHSPGNRLSGGEQQMLAMARILRTGARLLLLDEITEGLAPVIVARLAEVVQVLKKRGFTVLLVEQNFHFAAPLADRHYVMESGRVVDVVSKEELSARKQFLNKYLGV